MPYLAHWYFWSIFKREPLSLFKILAAAVLNSGQWTVGLWVSWLLAPISAVWIGKQCRRFCHTYQPYITWTHTSLLTWNSTLFCNEFYKISGHKWRNNFKESNDFYLQTSKTKMNSSVAFIKFISLLKACK